MEAVNSHRFCNSAQVCLLTFRDYVDCYPCASWRPWQRCLALGRFYPRFLPPHQPVITFAADFALCTPKSAQRRYFDFIRELYTCLCLKIMCQNLLFFFFFVLVIFCLKIASALPAYVEFCESANQNGAYLDIPLSCSAQSIPSNARIYMAIM